MMPERKQWFQNLETKDSAFENEYAILKYNIQPNNFSTIFIFSMF